MKKISILIIAVSIFVGIASFFSFKKISAQEYTYLPVYTRVFTPSTSAANDFCKSISVDKPVLGPGQTIKITLTAKTNEMTKFVFKFYNRENTNTNPKIIKFAGLKTAINQDYVLAKEFSVSRNQVVLELPFQEFDRPDKNFNSYRPKPKHIRVDGFFSNAANQNSKINPNCQTNFRVDSIDPTPTPFKTPDDKKCLCNTNGICSPHTTGVVSDKYPCFQDKYASDRTTGIIYYNNSFKCNLSGFFSSEPTAEQKNNWCQRYFKSKGDANGDGKANLLDYFYYVTVQYGGKVPPTINPDFSGDGYINGDDRNIIIKSLKQQ